MLTAQEAIMMIEEELYQRRIALIGWMHMYDNLIEKTGATDIELTKLYEQDRMRILNELMETV